MILELSDEPRSKCVANQFTTEVEVTRGPIADAACNSQTKLVEPKLEMVRAGGLFHCGAFVYHFYWVNTHDRFQRDEIDSRLQRSIGPSQCGSGCD